MRTTLLGTTGGDTTTLIQLLVVDHRSPPKTLGLIADGALIERDAHSLRFTRDVVFTSPSNDAQNILARNANGWIEWIRESDGKTLDEVVWKREK